MVLNKEKGNKKEKLTESIHLMVKIGRRSNYNIDLIKLCLKKFSAETTKRFLMENLPTLRNDSSFAVQFSFSVLLRGENDLKQLDEIQATVVGVWIFSGTTQYGVLESD